MDLTLLQDLIQDKDPIQQLYDVLMGRVWTSARWLAAQEARRMREYLDEGEHLASELEWELYQIYQDIYAILETTDVRQQRMETLLDQSRYTLLLIDGLSLREVPLLCECAESHGISVFADYALVAPPTDTSDFARTHFQASGPSDMATNTRRYPFAFRHVTLETWEPNFTSEEHRRFIWYAFPDDYFHLKDTDYLRHVIQPVQSILEAVLEDPRLVCPLVITSDHGYLWQGGRCTWALQDHEATMMAGYFKQGRTSRQATQRLADTELAWVAGNQSAARGRFDWGSKVRGGSSLFKHGGVSLMECLVPWLVYGSKE
jgi:hypothetical protein